MATNEGHQVIDPTHRRNTDNGNQHGGVPHIPSRNTERSGAPVLPPCGGGIPSSPQNRLDCPSPERVPENTRTISGYDVPSGCGSGGLDSSFPLPTTAPQLAVNALHSRDLTRGVLQRPVPASLSNHPRTVAGARTTVGAVVPRGTPRIIARPPIPRRTAPTRRLITKNKRNSRSATGGAGSKPSAGGGRGSGFTQQELDNLLELLEEHLPLCRDKWNTVVQLHEQRYPGQDRNVDSLKRKFASLYKTKMPTGDPNIPPHVKKAKRVRGMMTERSDMGDGESLEEIVDSITPNTAPSTAQMFYTDDGTDDDINNDDTDEPRSGALVLSENEENEGNPASLPSSGNLRNISPRPLVRKRNAGRGENTEEMDLVSIMKMSLLQEQSRRADEVSQRERDRIEDKERREMERISREQDREDERVRMQKEQERREANERGHDQLMEMMMVMMTQNLSQGGSTKPSQQ